MKWFVLPPLFFRYETGEIAREHNLMVHIVCHKNDTSLRLMKCSILQCFLGAYMCLQIAFIIGTGEQDTALSYRILSEKFERK